MSPLDKLERRSKGLGRFNLMPVLIGLYAAGYLVVTMFPEVYAFLYFDPQLILKGQVWRLVSFVMIPSSTQLFVALITCFIYFSISRAIGMTLGLFKLNFFLISGLVIEVLAGFLYYVVMKNTMYVIALSPYYMYATLFVLFAMMYPDARFLFMFIFPIRGRYMVFVTLALYLVEVVIAFRQVAAGYGWMLVFMIVAAVLNLLLFLLLSNYTFRRRPSNVVRMQGFRRAEAEAEKKIRTAPRHKCAVCGRTDRTHPELEFRYCTRCEGSYEYCMEHLYTHQHVTLPKDGHETDE